MEINYGFTPQEISLTIAGFAVQSGFIDAMGGIAPIESGGGTERGLLYYLFRVFGLIGFTLLVFMWRKIGMAAILAWCVIMIMVLVRPVSDSLFFINLTDDPALKRAVTYGGIGDDTTTRAAIGDVASNDLISYEAMLKTKYADLDWGRIYGITLHAKIIDVMNNLNFAIATEIMPMGAKMIERSNAFINAATQARSLDDEAAYHIAEYAQLCGGVGGPNMTFDLYRDAVKKPEFEELTKSTISAEAAINMYQQYANYRAANQAKNLETPLLPPLVLFCDGFNTYGCEEGAARRAPEVDIFNPVRNKLLPMTYSSGASNPWGRHIEVADVVKNVGDMKAYVGVDPQVLQDTKVMLVVPTNFERMRENLEKTLEERGSAIDPNRACRHMRQIQEGDGSFGAWASCLFGAEPDPNDPAVQAYMREARSYDAGKTPFGDGKVMLVSTCADLHQVKSARQMASNDIESQLSDSYEAAMKKVAADLKRTGKVTDFSALSADDQARHVQDALVASAGIECMQQSMSHHSGMINETARKACLQSRREEAERLMSYAMANKAMNETARMRGIMANAMAPEFSSGVRQFASDIGSFVAPIAIWFKGLLGGFQAGTYSQIMPMVITFGINLLLIISPLLMLLGILLPMYAFNALLLPILGLAYFQLVKTTFLLVKTVAYIFMAQEGIGSQIDQAAKMQDIALGNAYGMAFLLTAALMALLRNPSALIQQIAGKADAASSVSFQEVMAAGGAVALAKKAANAGVAVATGGKSLAVKAAAAKAIGGGSMAKGAGMMLGASFKADTLKTMKGAVGNIAAAEELDALRGSDPGAVESLYEGEKLKGAGAADDLLSKINPEERAEKKKNYARTKRDQAASQRGLKKLTRGERTRKQLPDGSYAYEDLDPFLDEIEDALVKGMIARDPAKYDNGKGAGLDRAKAEASSKIEAAIRNGLINKDNTTTYKNSATGRVDKKVVNVLSRAIEKNVMNVQKPRYVRDPETGKHVPKKDKE